MNEHEEPQANAAARQPNERERPFLSQTKLLARWLEGGELIIQSAVGVLLFLGALFGLGYTVYDFIHEFTAPALTISLPEEQVHLTVEQSAADALITLVANLLLVLIIGEVFSTILHYLRDRVISLKPFLFIGIISATRDILVITARALILSERGDDFTHSMIELGVTLGIILGLSLALRLLRKEDTTDPI